jgi:hypothetical protein
LSGGVTCWQLFWLNKEKEAACDITRISVADGVWNNSSGGTSKPVMEIVAPVASNTVVIRAVP